MVNARLHIICGNCGSNEDFEWKVDPRGNCDAEGNEHQDVDIICTNCSTIHSLTSVLGDENGRPPLEEGKDED